MYAMLKHDDGWTRAEEDEKGGGGFVRDVKTRDAREDRLCFVNNDNSSSNAYKQQRRAAHGLNVLQEINGIREWDTRCNPFVPKSFVNTATIIPCRDS